MKIKFALIADNKKDRQKTTAHGGGFCWDDEEKEIKKKEREKMREFLDIIMPKNVEEITDALINELSANGRFRIDDLKALRSSGFSYCRERESFISPVIYEGPRGRKK